MSTLRCLKMRLLGDQVLEIVGQTAGNGRIQSLDVVDQRFRQVLVHAAGTEIVAACMRAPQARS